MRIPTSSSILLATLAISSSSTCLAAPTGDAPQDGISTTNSHISSMHNSGVPRAEGMPIYKRDESNTQGMQARDISPVVSVLNGVPIVGSVLGSIISKLLPAVGTATAQSVDPQDLDELQNAVAQITHALNGTLANSPLPGPAKEVPGTIISKTPLGAESDNDASGPNANTDPGSADASMSSSAPSSTASAPAVADNGSPSSSTSASYTPAAASPSASPPMPANPPNTPSPPVQPPSLPVNA